MRPKVWVVVVIDRLGKGIVTNSGAFIAEETAGADFEITPSAVARLVWAALTFFSLLLGRQREADFKGRLVSASAMEVMILVLRRRVRRSALQLRRTSRHP